MNRIMAPSLSKYLLVDSGHPIKNLGTEQLKKEISFKESNGHICCIYLDAGLKSFNTFIKDRKMRYYGESF